VVGDIIIKLHKSQLKNSNITITQSAKFFCHCVTVIFEFSNCDLCSFLCVALMCEARSSVVVWFVQLSQLTSAAVSHSSEDTAAVSGEESMNVDISTHQLIQSAGRFSSLDLH